MCNVCHANVMTADENESYRICRVVPGERLLSRIVLSQFVSYSAVQSQKAETAHFSSKQLLLTLAGIFFY